MDADRQNLIDENNRLRSENTELKATVARLTKQGEQRTKRIEELTAALEEARRSGKHQAAPFRKKFESCKLKNLGRKPGDQCGKHARGATPTAQQSLSDMVLLFPRLASVVSARRSSLASPLCSIKWKSLRIPFIAHLRSRRALPKMRKNRSAPA